MVLLEPQPFEHRLDGDWRQAGRSTDAPVRTTRIPAPIEIMETPVSTGQWLDCVAAGACLAPSGPADRPDLPVTGVSWLDAAAYAEWLSGETGQTWRLPADVEWAFAAAEMFRDDALGVDGDPDNPAVLWLAEYAADAARSRELDREVRPVGSLNVNSRGLRDIGGAVWEWTSTCLRRVDQASAGQDPVPGRNLRHLYRRRAASRRRVRFRARSQIGRLLGRRAPCQPGLSPGPRGCGLTNTPDPVEAFASLPVLRH